MGEYKKALTAKATIGEVIEIVNATLARHIEVRHRPWWKRWLPRRKVKK